MKTVADVVALIKKNIEGGNEFLANHNRGLLGPRTRGSTTKVGLEDLPPDKTIIRQHMCEVLAKGSKLYTLRADMGAIIGAVEFGEIFESDHKITARVGEHGIELVTDKSKFECVETDQISIITTTHEGIETVATWHPGPVMARLEDGIRYETAVKLV